MASSNLSRSSVAVLLTLTPAALLALSDGAVDPAALSGGTFTVAAESESAYQQPAPVLDAAQLEVFMGGRKGFDQRWVVAPSILGLWGRGPTSNGEACIDCHENGG
ncbi:MAG TPA: di-heme oxidoredictase family protein, partial [Burkholderiales bacterium]|nr:di-heme oxidoredictase family protein [Burkholderiales bacterium]